LGELSLKPADQDVDQIFAVRRLDPVLAEQLQQILPRQLAVIGTEEDSGDGSLHVD
jgi:hypothetical protein